RYLVPAEAGPAAADLAALLDEADQYCTMGDYLLTLRTPTGALEYRRWYIGQFVEQIAGASPVSFPDWSPAEAVGS
ncbi:MAG: hypothetical protein M3Q68_08275, partial [Actinomycetota bacterium]|nr:hypothetical protein [Actinomycetota bacterium]